MTRQRLQTPSPPRQIGYVALYVRLAAGIDVIADFAPIREETGQIRQPLSPAADMQQYLLSGGLAHSRILIKASAAKAPLVVTMRGLMSNSSSVEACVSA